MGATSYAQQGHVPERERGRDALTPREIPGKGWLDILLRVKTADTVGASQPQISQQRPAHR